MPLTVEGLSVKLAGLRSTIEQKMAAQRTAMEGAKAKPEAIAAEMESSQFMLMGLDLFGELFIDIKRVADAVARYTDPKPISVDDMGSNAVDAAARRLAHQHFSHTHSAQELSRGASGREAWVEGNWKGFRDDAVDVVRATLGLPPIHG